MSDDELNRLTRAYLNRRTGRALPSHLHEDVTSSILSGRRHRRPLATTLGAVALVIASAAAAVVVVAVHDNNGGSRVIGSAQSPTQVVIVRTPGNLVLPSIDRTITDPQMAARLAADIEGLPEFPQSERCPADFGTAYTLTFVMPDGSSSWAATIGAQGCELVRVANQPTRWAMHSPGLWADLASALGLSPSEIRPAVCLGTNSSPGCAPLVTPSI